MKRWLISLMGALVLLLALVADLPSLASTAWGTRWIAKRLGSRCGGELHIGKLSLSWLGVQHAEHLQFTHPEHNLQLGCQALSVKTPLWKLLLDREGSMQVHGGYGSVKPHEATPLLLRSDLLTLNVTWPSSIEWSALGIVEHNGSMGHLATHGTFHMVPTGAVQIALDAQIQQLPVAALDALGHALVGISEGACLALLGEELNGRLQLLETGNWSIFLESSSRCSLQLAACSQGGLTTLTAPSNLRLSIAPELVALIYPQAPFRLEAPFFFDCTLSDWVVPLQGPWLPSSGTIHYFFSPSVWAENNQEGNWTLERCEGALALDSATSKLHGVWLGDLLDPFGAIWSSSWQGDLLQPWASPPGPFSLTGCWQSPYTNCRAFSARWDNRTLQLLDPALIQVAPSRGSPWVDWTLTHVSLESKQGEAQTLVAEGLLGASNWNFMLQCPHGFQSTHAQGGLHLTNFSLQQLPLLPSDAPAWIFEPIEQLDLQFATTHVTRNLHIVVAHPHIHGSAEFLFKDNSWKLAEGTLSGTLQPSSPPLATSLELQTPVSWSIQANRVAVPSDRPLEPEAPWWSWPLDSLSWGEAEGTFDATSTELHLIDPVEEEVIHVDPLHLHAECTEGFAHSWLLESLISTHRSSLEESSPPSTEGHLQFRCDNKPGEWTIDLHMAEFPLAILSIVPGAPPLAEWAGSYAYAQIEARLRQRSGPLRFQWRSANWDIDLKATLQDGVAQLTENAFLRLHCTPSFSRELLSSVPLGIQEISAKEPFEIEISHMGTSIPLFPFAPERLTIPSARIDLGRLICTNQGALKLTLGLLKQVELTQQGQLALWWAPMELHIQNGTIQCERTEFLVADRYEAALWGTCSAMNGTLAMTLGLPSSTLKQAFGLRSLPAPYVLQIPLRGTFDHLQVDTGGATTHIATLMLWQHQQSMTGSNAPWGGLLRDILPPPPGGEYAAPPAHHPFPWEQKGAKEPKLSKKRARVLSQKRESWGKHPFKQLWKLLKP